MLTILVWYLWLELLGLLGLALAWPLCRALPDRGYCAAKTLGALGIGLLTWWSYSLGLLRNNDGGALLALGGLAVAGLGVARGRRAAELLEWLRRNLRLVITIELLQVIAFLGWCLVRANDPAADHTEEPMDLMLLVAVSSSDSFPPADPWLAGYPISYYYLGYWLLGTLGHLAGTAPEITYNLGQAAWFSLLLVGSFGLAYDLATLVGGKEGEGRRVDGARAGLLAALLVGVSANLALPLEWGRRLLAGTAGELWSENWWWWRSSRVVKDVGFDGEPIEVITEFPFFSYLLGDNHPHVLAMPLVVASLTLALAVVTVAWGGDGRDARRVLGSLPVTSGATIGIVAAAGSLVAVNTWDVPATWAVLVLSVAAAAGAARGWRPAMVAGAGFAAVLVVGTALLYLPYHLTASSQVEGVLPNLFHPTSLGQPLVMFATLLPGVALLVWAALEPGGARLRGVLLGWGAMVAAAALWLLACTLLARSGALWGQWAEGLLAAVGGRSHLAEHALERWLRGWPTLVIVAGGLALVLETLRARWSAARSVSDAALCFALLLVAVALALVLAPELLYLHDSFGTRMNTVFKFWYQAWLLLGCAGAVGLGLAIHGGGGRRLAAGAALLVIVPGLFYPVRALDTKTSGFGAQEPTLDSLAWVARYRPEEWSALRWLRTSTAPDDLVVQRSGGSYRPEHNLPSMVTGRPTLLGWGGHEYQWRGAAFGSYSAGREEALQRLYQPASVQELERVLDTWNVSYVYLGPEERKRYQVTSEQEGVLAATMDLVFENAQVRIYRRRG